MKFQILGQEIYLLPERALYIPDADSLVLSDIHLGKVTHFRKSGLPVPPSAKFESLQNLENIIHKTNPGNLLILGDLFHSVYNAEWEGLKTLISMFSGISVTLIIGNHDILSPVMYADAGISVLPEIQIGAIKLTHEPMESLVEGSYNIHGHTHPAVIIKGGGRQRMRLPCFVFGRRVGVLPAFGHFTGMHTIRPDADDRVFVIGGNEIHQFQ